MEKPGRTVFTRDVRLRGNDPIRSDWLVARKSLTDHFPLLFLITIAVL